MRSASAYLTSKRLSSVYRLPKPILSSYRGDEVRALEESDRQERRTGREEVQKEERAKRESAVEPDTITSTLLPWTCATRIILHQA